MQPNYRDTIQQKRAIAAQSAKEQSELGAMLTELKKMQMASLMGQSKPSVVLTDQTDLGDKINELTTKLVAAVKSTDTTGMTKEQLTLLHRTLDAHEQLKAEYTKQALGMSQDSKALLAAIKALKLSTVVNVPDPKVTIQERDFQPLIDAIYESRSDNHIPDDGKKVDLECYRAQDIKEDDGIQYVGFVNPDGAWYIIENNISANKMRYVFGASGYAAAFAKAAQYEYRLLNEAYNATA